MNPGGGSTQKRSEVVATMPMPLFSGKLVEGESPVQNELAVPGLNFLADDSDLGASPVVCAAERNSRNSQSQAFGLGVLYIWDSASNKHCISEHV